MRDVATARSRVPAGHVAAVVAGNALEFYDFLTYAFFAVYIGRAFFPSSDPSSSLLASLGTFGVGFVMRPIGGIVIGRMGDRLGRKPAMVFTFSLMGFAIIGLALTPPHSMIGVAAPALAILFRMMQGFALGGEVGPSTAFLLEAAPPERRGFYTAFQTWSQHLSILAAGLVGYLLSSTLNERQLQTFGWRIAFLAGAVIVPFGIMVRRNLPETLHPADGGPRVHIPLRPYLGLAFVGVMLLASATIGTYVIGYMTTFAIATLHMPTNVAFAATIVVGVSGLLFVLPGGALSDRIGRKTMMLVPGALLLLAIFPVFSMIVHRRTTATLLLGTAILSSLLAFYGCPIIIWLTESFPAAIRSGGLGIIYAFSIATFGGTTQYAVTWLIKVTKNPLVPAWYWTAALVIGLAGISLAQESAPYKVSRARSIDDFIPAEASAEG